MATVVRMVDQLSQVSSVVPFQDTRKDNSFFAPENFPLCLRILSTMEPSLSRALSKTGSAPRVSILACDNNDTWDTMGLPWSSKVYWSPCRDNTFIGPRSVAISLDGGPLLFPIPLPHFTKTQEPTSNTVCPAFFEAK